MDQNSEEPELIIDLITEEEIELDLDFVHLNKEELLNKEIILDSEESSDQTILDNENEIVEVNSSQINKELV